MTVNYARAGVQSASVERTDHLPPPITRRDWRVCGAATAILLVLYLLLQNGLWAAGPDTAFYTSVARELAREAQFKFNGGFVGRAPPGWPVVLSLGMRISPTFAFINLIPMACILATVAMWYFILRRFVASKQAFWMVLLAGTGYWWYASTVQLRSEALFCLIFTAAVLVAADVWKCTHLWLRLPFLALLCAAMVCVRYAGLPAAFVVAGVALTGVRANTAGRHLLAVLLIAGSTVGAYLGIRYVIEHVLPQEVVSKPNPAGGGGGGGGPAITGPAGTKLDVYKPDDEGGTPSLPATMIPKNAVGKFAVQGLLAGQWTAGVLWMPSHVAVSNRALAMVVNVFGWYLLVVYFIYAGRMAKVKNFILLGAALYCAAIICRWGVVNPRYLMPVAPLILLGVWMGFHTIATNAKRPGVRRFFSLGVPLLVGTVALSNLALFAVDAYIARSGQFYKKYYAGELNELVGAAHYLREAGVKDGEVAVNAQIINLNRARPNGFGMRGLVMLMDKGITAVPTRVEGGNKVQPGHMQKPKPTKKGKGKPKAVAAVMPLLASDMGVRTPAAAATARRPTTGPTSQPTTQPLSRRAEIKQLVEKIGAGEPGNEALIKYAEMMNIRYYVYRPPVTRAWHFKPAFLQKDKKGQRQAERKWELYEFRGGKMVRIPIPDPGTWPRRVPGL